MYKYTTSQLPAAF